MFGICLQNFNALPARPVGETDIINPDLKQVGASFFLGAWRKAKTQEEEGIGSNAVEVRNPEPTHRIAGLNPAAPTNSPSLATPESHQDNALSVSAQTTPDGLVYRSRSVTAPNSFESIGRKTNVIPAEYEVDLSDQYAGRGDCGRSVGVSVMLSTFSNTLTCDQRGQVWSVKTSCIELRAEQGKSFLVPVLDSRQPDRSCLTIEGHKSSREAQESTAKRYALGSVLKRIGLTADSCGEEFNFSEAKTSKTPGPFGTTVSIRGVTPNYENTDGLARGC